MKFFSCLRLLAWGRFAVLFALLLVISGCGEDTAQNEGEVAEPEPEETAQVEEQPKVTPVQNGPVLETTPALPASVANEAVPIEEKFPDNSIRRRYTIRTYTDFDRSNPARGGWEYNGPYEEFYSNGQQLCQGQYADNLLTGHWTWWHSNGNKSKEATYEDGAVTGEVRIWREDATLQRVESYAAGQKDGTWLYYADDGETVLARHEYKGGTLDGVVIEWYPDGVQKKQETHFTNGQLDGTRTTWYQDGAQAAVENYRDGKPHGRFAYWSPNKVLLREQQYESGRRISGQG